MKEIQELTKKYEELIIKYRRDFHQHPELAYQEKRTAEKVAEVLEGLGMEVKRNVGKTGVVGILSGREKGKVLALRADMDALPIQEETGLAFSSVNKDVMHACGHDMHTAILLGCAHVLTELKEELKGTIKFIFQPAEENNPVGGAPGMIDDGVLENPKVDAMLALHVWPQLQTGTAAIKTGTIMGASDRIFISIKGKSSHGSQPENGIDSVAIASNVVSVLQSIVARNIGPLDAAVISICKIYGGTKYNVIADKVQLEGTVRTVDPDIRNAMPKRIENLIKGVTSAMGGEYAFKYVKGYPPTINDSHMTNLVFRAMQHVLGNDALIAPTSALGGEDFAFFATKVPSAYFWLGCRDRTIPFEEAAPIHNPKFNPDEKALPIGVALMVQAALDFCESSKSLATVI
ncbi:M20 metallopeptidase family protein [Geosporobacter ferrireducens]|uniref:Peptidase M20 n=1 Tax=Geosporobacter ferrireducens TaxID=1424294 RepID=A0A1D8GDI4_9FIRM|nr:amidohydrolase [Geosporobacter ferrireducens]AOT68969.1 peptidase M20 [Geosporobacter ferrireducens]MTI54790.1 amidohydrolase [Geosporobacter ferrireducens]